MTSIELTFTDYCRLVGGIGGWHSDWLLFSVVVVCVVVFVWEVEGVFRKKKKRKRVKNIVNTIMVQCCCYFFFLDWFFSFSFYFGLSSTGLWFEWGLIS